MNRGLNWRKTEDELPSKDNESPILAFAPLYSENNSLRWRILQGYLVKFCKDVKFWIPIKELEENIKLKGD